jgi:hypothetical protein
VAGDLLVRRWGINSRGIGVDARKVRESKKLTPDSPWYTFDTKVEDLIGQFAYGPRQTTQHALPYRHVPRKERPECVRRHRSNQRFLHRKYVGDASATVDGGVLTKQLACGNIPENDSASAPAFGRHANHAGDNEMDVSICSAASDHILVALVAGPFAPIGDGA